MAITRFGPRSMKGQSRFRGNPKSALQIKTCLERSVSPYNAPVPILTTQVLVNSKLRR